MSQWTYRSASIVTAGNGAGNALNVPRPVGVASGDLVVLVAYWETDTNTITASDSLTSMIRQVNTGSFMLETFAKIAGSSEPINYVLTPVTNSQWRVALCAAWSNGTAALTLDVSGGSQADAVGLASQTAPSVTTTGTNRLLVLQYGNISGTDVTTLTGAVTTLRQSYAGQALGDAARASAGATGTSRPNAGPGTETYAAMHSAIVSDAAAGADPIARIRIERQAVTRGTVW